MPVLSSRCSEWPGLTRRIGTAGTLNLPARRFSVEQTPTLDPNYCYTVKELALLWNMSPESIRRMLVNDWSFGCGRLWPPHRELLAVERRGMITHG